MTKSKVYGQKETGPERLRLLEAVAEAMQEALDGYLNDADLFEAMDKGETALAALEALDEKEQP